MLNRLLISASAMLLATPAFAQVQDAIDPSPLPAPGIMGLVAAGIVASVVVARRRK
jgi:hypothetical protein